MRRKYLEALPAYPQCQVAIDLIKELYAVERTIPSLHGLVGPERQEALDLRKKVRKKESAPLMDALHAWALEQSALPGSLLDKALSYMLNLWPGLKVFVEDPRVPIDNNLVERDLRGVVRWGSLCITPSGCWQRQVALLRGHGTRSLGLHLSAA